MWLIAVSFSIIIWLIFLCFDVMLMPLWLCLRCKEAILHFDVKHYRFSWPADYFLRLFLSFLSVSLSISSFSSLICIFIFWYFDIYYYAYYHYLLLFWHYYYFIIIFVPFLFFHFFLRCMLPFLHYFAFHISIIISYFRLFSFLSSLRHYYAMKLPIFVADAAIITPIIISFSFHYIFKILFSFCSFFHDTLINIIDEAFRHYWCYFSRVPISLLSFFLFAKHTDVFHYFLSLLSILISADGQHYFRSFFDIFSVDLSWVDFICISSFPSSVRVLFFLISPISFRFSFLTLRWEGLLHQILRWWE